MSTPYADAAAGYLAAGWSPLPLPAGRKKNPPAGWTGAGAPHPSGADVAEWAANGHGAGNIGLRARPDQVGLDVDQYDDKTGGDTLTDLERRLGPLPATVVSSRRFTTDTVSGIRWFRLPPGVTSHGWPNTAGPSIEVIREGHRYGVAWPSTVDGLTYRWLDQRTGQLLDHPPAATDLPELPAAWIGHLAAKKHHDTSKSATNYLTPGEPCRPVLTALDRVAVAVAGANRHDDTGPALMRLVRLGEQGHRGVAAAVADTRDAFVTAVKTDRAGGTLEAVTEYRRLLDGAVAKVTTEPTADADKGCCDGPPAQLLDVDPTQAAPREGPRLRLVEATDVRTERVRYLWRDRIPTRAVTLMPGEEGIGKSSILARVAANVTHGTLEGDHHGQPGHVLIIASEDALGGVAKPRLEHAGADLARVTFVQAVIGDKGGADRDLVVPRDLPLVADVVAARGTRLVWIDSLVTTFPDDTKTVSYKDTATVLKRLGAFAEETGAAVVAPWHLNKQSGGETAVRMMDSRAFRTGTRSVLFVVADPDTPGEGVIALDKSNAARLDVPAIRYRLRTATYTVAEIDPDTGELRDVPGSCGVVDLVGEVPGDGREVARDMLAAKNRDHDPAAWLRHYLNEHGPSRTDAIYQAADAAGFTEWQIRNASKKLNVHTRDATEPGPKGTPRRHLLWRLPGQPAPAAPTHLRTAGPLATDPPGEAEECISALFGDGPSGPEVAKGVRDRGGGAVDGPEVCVCGAVNTVRHPHLGTVCARCGDPRPTPEETP